MTDPDYIISLSGGIDSTAAAICAVDAIETHQSDGNMRKKPMAMYCDTRIGNPLNRIYVEQLADWLGVQLWIGRTDEKFEEQLAENGFTNDSATGTVTTMSKGSRREEVLDATCGGRTIWLPGQKDHDNALYVDNREVSPDEFENRNYEVAPDDVQDFRDLPYDDGEFNLIVFDPPHKKLANGMDSISGVMNRQYGALHAETWQDDIRRGFDELWRVLAPGGTLVFKFAENNVSFDDILALAPTDPLFGTTTKNTKNGVDTRWFVFYKEDETDEQRQ